MNMRNDKGLANLIYEYFVVRFHFQYYKQGDSLPKTDALCRQFSVSSLTIKSAFKRLQEDGYIHRCRGRSAQVLFRQSDRELGEYAVRFFSERRAVIPDLYQSTELVVLPMMAKSLCRMDEQDFAVLSRLSEQPDPEDQIRFYCYILQKTQNPLVMNLFWESTLYLGLPFHMEDKGHRLYDAETSRKRLKELISAGRDKNQERIYEAHLAFQRDVSKQILSYINERIPEQPDIQPLPFVWKVYRDRPEICGNLAIRVIHDVYLGDFRDMEFLPSYEKLAQKYAVSVSSMRRTIGVLNQLGATESINGKGTRILMLSGAETEKMPDLAVSKIRRNMAYYLQSFELLADSCKGVMRMALENFSDAHRAELADLLKGYLQNERYEISAQSIFAYVAEHSPLQVIEEIYGKLYGLNLWGYPMAKYRKKTPGLDQTLITFTKVVIAAVLDNDAERFSETIHAFMQNENRIANDILMEHGYVPEDLSLSPSFSLLSTEEAARF